MELYQDESEVSAFGAKSGDFAVLE